MKKRVVLFSILIIFLTLSLYFTLAEDTTVADISNTNTEASKVDKAYNCLEEKVKDKCSSSLDENIFILMATGKCKDEVVKKAKSDECWPGDDCSIKTTAQAILALDKTSFNTKNAEEWLISQNTTPEEVVWYLQIESDKAASCDITYSGSSYNTEIREDKKISSSAGSCLSLAEGNYWLRVSPDCYNTEFQISCDNGFLTNLLYKKQGSSTIYVSETTNSASAEGTTTEKINSFCFSTSDVCDYEGSLWAAMVLNYQGYKVDPYLPYLVTMAEDNDKLLPEAFLYLLGAGNDFRTAILGKQISNKYWDASGDKFYDTAFALVPFSKETIQQKKNAISWLLEVQDSSGSNNGCWGNGNLKNTAFILYSIWPKGISGGTGTGESDCEDSGNYCSSEIDCTSSKGSVLKDYSGCFFPDICCTEPTKLKTCTEIKGTVCISKEYCTGTTDSASDLDVGEKCCVTGICKESTGEEEAPTCTGDSRTCRLYDCKTDEQETNSYTCESGYTCCTKTTTTTTKNYLWVWILAISIVLLIIAIIFRDKLRISWFRVKSGFVKSKPKGPPSSPFPMMPSSRIPQAGPPRRILPPGRVTPRQIPGTRKPAGELDDVLKKLKEMGK